MRRPILLDNPPPRPLPSVQWSRFLNSQYLSIGGLVAGGVAVVIGASIALAMLVPNMSAPDMSAKTAVSDASAKPVAASTGGVQYVGDVKQVNRPCGQQTWPYIAASCLKPVSEVDQKPAPARVAVDRSELKASRAGQPSRLTAAVVEAPAVAQPEQKVVAAPIPEITAPGPTARSAPRHAARQPAVRDDQKRARSARADPKDIRPDARSEARRAYAAAPSDRNPSPTVVRQQAEYGVQGPFEAFRQVLAGRPQSIHQAAAFSGER